MARRLQFALGEWYHCFNRGVDKRNVFEKEYDANRFLMLLYAANAEESIDLFRIRKVRLQDILASERGEPIVAIGAYCLMSNHYHLLLKEVVEGGITSFMRKIGTAYTMYFNANNSRVGHLFSGPFRARHIHNDRYFQKVVEYIHCNPAELLERGWKKGKLQNIHKLQQTLMDYPYSSLKTFASEGNADPIISREVLELAHMRPLGRMLEEARDYYADITKDSFER